MVLNEAAHRHSAVDLDCSPVEEAAETCATFDAGAKKRTVFCAASLWEITTKNSLGREDFRVDARLLRRGLLDNGYTELSITSEHAINVDHLPSIHKDPFDRILVAQATVEGITLVTNDRKLGNYPGPIRKV